MSETERHDAPLITPDVVRALARVADLELPPDRVEAVAEQLDGLLSEANAVNRFMETRREVQPGIRYHHPEVEEPRP